MNVSLTTELEDYVNTQVKSGLYRSASEVVREALRNQIRRGMDDQLAQRISLGRQQVAEGRVAEANENYLESKRAMIRDRFEGRDQG
ncbi:MAG: type II toxin-antitoxin system ParD family antitoxin [Chromatiales bacterium]|uniref:type II toxin-antitoxin system ParD family antitoxin n=1 Tax=endosymbiont of Lamellibrachia barhami TaxID=205975 RepID=UPI0015A9B78B|nr:type II toxin-antitoxin system ParD family antitoxin [endosymbiont of Lamellibrachia barhami]MBA1446715.1 type II toxin-antitoxin system ParD family antitoxin [Gammaproteobacteria bacterium]